MSNLDVNSFDGDQNIFNIETKEFLSKLLTTFNDDVEKLYSDRKARKLHYDKSDDLPRFPDTECRRDKAWKIDPLPARLQRRNIDVGDVSPADCAKLLAALKADVDGIQVDFDDGHCPSWSNQIKGWTNIIKFCSGTLDETVPTLSEAPVLMLRPRAWNMMESNILVSGQQCPAPLIDFGVLLHHCGRVLYDAGAGPFLYLSKLESSEEAGLWRRIFEWTETQLDLPRGSIKACVLIENVLATFQMEEILWQLRHRSAGIFCVSSFISVSYFSIS